MGAQCFREGSSGAGRTGEDWGNREGGCGRRESCDAGHASARPCERALKLPTGYACYTVKGRAEFELPRLP